MEIHQNGPWWMKCIPLSLTFRCFYLICPYPKSRYFMLFILFYLYNFFYYPSFLFLLLSTLTFILASKRTTKNYHSSSHSYPRCYTKAFQFAADLILSHSLLSHPSILPSRFHSNTTVSSKLTSFTFFYFTSSHESH
jgi:hypothetical protein